MEDLLVIYALGAIACAAFSGVVARSKGRSYMMWALGGLLFGPIALLAAVGITDVETERRFNPEDHGQTAAKK